MQGQKTMGWVLTGAGTLIVIGSLLPWANVLGISVAGTEGDGAITLVLGLVVAAIGILTALRDLMPWMVVVALFGVVFTLTVAVIDMIEVARTEFSSIGIGLWVIVVGSLVGAFACYRLYQPSAKPAGGGEPGDDDDSAGA